MRANLYAAAIIGGFIAVLMSGIAIWHALYDRGHWVLAYVYAAQIVVAGYWGMRANHDMDRLKRRIEQAERETGQKFFG